MLEEFVDDQVEVRQVRSPVYIDALLMRQRDTDGNGTLDERLWPVHDANFNVVALVNDSGTVVEKYAYDVFGAVTVMDASYNVLSGSAYAWVYLHQGGRLDVESGLYHFRHREYHPHLGRWLQRDPIGFDAMDVNLYRALSNSLINLVDPSGLKNQPASKPADKDPIKALLGRPWELYKPVTQQIDLFKPFHELAPFLSVSNPPNLLFSVGQKPKLGFVELLALSRIPGRCLYGLKVKHL